MNFNQLKLIIYGENGQIRDHITSAFQQHISLQDIKEYRKRLLDSLWFRELYSREERIADAHRKTFEWIFDRSGQRVGPWDNFIQWLENGKETYWINGKAGSGKSTLMSFLCDDARTKHSLRIWSGSKILLMPRFYFWSDGKHMEKSIEGLLRSLLWQIIDGMPNLQLDDHRHIREPTAAWTERRLRRVLAETVEQALKTHSFCFFIDGLDQFNGDQDTLIAFVQETVLSNKVKICLSSRPHRAFTRAFATSAKLRLHDLPREDIQSFVKDKLGDVAQIPLSSSQYSRWPLDITERILERAAGVFLWVSLAVKDQLRGFRNGDNPRQLKERLDTLPDEIEKIYERMLSHIEKVYTKEASVSLQIALHRSSSSLLGYVLASHENLDNFLGSADKLPELELVAMPAANYRQYNTAASLDARIDAATLTSWTARPERRRNRPHTEISERQTQADDLEECLSPDVGMQIRQQEWQLTHRCHHRGL